MEAALIIPSRYKSSRFPGKPLAKLIRYEPDQAVKRKPGFWRGRVKMAEDFDTLPEDVAAAFRGERP